MMNVPTWMFDAVIAVLVTAVPLYFAERWLHRRRGLAPSSSARAFIALLLIIGWGTLVYGAFIEPRILVTRAYPITLGAGQHHLKIAVIGDFHLGIYKGEAWLAKVVARVNATEPDLILLTGDFASSESGLLGLGPLRDLCAKFGVFAALGNYDYRSGAVEIRHLVESHDVEVLTNESIDIPVPGTDRPVRLIGLDDYWFGDWSWKKALADVPVDALKIAVVHNPDFVADAEKRGVDLVIGGHTHAGQLRLPLIGPLTKLPVVIGQQYGSGLFAFGPTQLFINPGVGETGPRARLFNPPEVSVLDVVW